MLLRDSRFTQTGTTMDVPDRPSGGSALVRKDVREFIRKLEAAGLEVQPTPGHYRVLRDGKPLRKENGMPFMLPFSPDTTRWRRSATLELSKLGIDVQETRASTRDDARRPTRP
jgi:hypothetical protein